MECGEEERESSSGDSLHMECYRRHYVYSGPTSADNHRSISVVDCMGHMYFSPPASISPASLMRHLEKAT